MFVKHIPSHNHHHKQNTEQNRLSQFLETLRVKPSLHTQALATTQGISPPHFAFARIACKGNHQVRNLSGWLFSLCRKHLLYVSVAQPFSWLSTHHFLFISLYGPLLPLSRYLDIFLSFSLEHSSAPPGLDGAVCASVSPPCPE